MGNASSDRLQILVVDDDEVDRISVRRNFNQTLAQVNIVEAVTCQAALALIQQQPFDCAFIDYNLPDGNGIDLVEQLRRSGVKFPLIALTGHGDEQVAVDLMKAGASDYIAKSKIRPDLLYRILQQCLRLYQVEQEAERTKQQREELLRQREEFISRMTHDLQTPLVAANRMLELIQDDAFGDISTSAKAKMAVIIRSNDGLLKMVQDLVEVYTYDAGCKQINLFAIDIRELIEEVLQELLPLATNKQLDLKSQIEVAAANYEIALDRLEFKRVLINLIGNSLKFTEAGSIMVKVTGSAAQHPFVKVAVQDTGVGISGEDQAQLFERFRRGNHKRSNSGLGLYLCRQIVERHGGTISVESELNQGSTFTILLPV